MYTLMGWLLARGRIRAEVARLKREAMKNRVQALV